MSPGPSKSFDPAAVLESARDVFWRRGYDGAGLSELEAAMGIGRKSLYDTFGSKRELYLRALEQYTETVIQKICRGLEDPRSGPLENLERVLDRLQKYHSSADSRGCLLGVAMAQAGPQDAELTELLRGYLRRLEHAFERTVRSAQSEGLIDRDARPKDVACNLVALTQGIALIGRITGRAPEPRASVRAALHALMT
jgi:TetR/AcrR family transcriptional repressor of nem operon